MHVLDVDTHVIEPDSVWDYLTKTEEEFVPSIVSKRVGGPVDVEFATPGSREFWVIDNEIYGKHDTDAIVAGSNGELSEATITLENVGQRLDDMDKQGVDVQVIFSSLFLGLRIERPDAELALVRAYNRWMAERCSESGGRLRWIMVPSLKNPAETIADIDWARKHGAVGILLRGIEGNRSIDHQEFDPLYSKAEELDLPICVHIGHGSDAFASIERRRKSRFNRFFCDSPVYFALSAILQSNLKKRFPRLRFGFFESGSSWIPATVQTTFHLRLPPAELMERTREIISQSNVFVTCELHEDLTYIAQYVGHDNLVLGSDYGHPNDIADTMIEYRRRLEGRTDIDAEFGNKLISGNCHRLFSL